MVPLRGRWWGESSGRDRRGIAVNGGRRRDAGWMRLLFQLTLRRGDEIHGNVHALDGGRDGGRSGRRRGSGLRGLRLKETSKIRNVAIAR